ncbi:hypothetical protein F5Y17DRAFT_455367 [Xylariaceae sp. FL0594]|nr:hypothetical protein F5Y17DRAFT_455367 [Xylariaceae sp. FL0594]
MASLSKYALPAKSLLVVDCLFLHSLATRQIDGQPRGHNYVTANFSVAIGVTVATVILGTTLICAFAHCWRQILDGYWYRRGGRRREKRSYLKKHEEAWFCGSDRSGGGLPMPLIAQSGADLSFHPYRQSQYQDQGSQPDLEQGLGPGPEYYGLDAPESTTPRSFLNYEIRATPSPPPAAPPTSITSYSPSLASTSTAAFALAPAFSPMPARTPCGRRLDVPPRKELPIPPSHSQGQNSDEVPILLEGKEKEKKNKRNKKTKTRKSYRRIAETTTMTTPMLPSWQDT